MKWVLTLNFLFCVIVTGPVLWYGEIPSFLLDPSDEVGSVLVKEAMWNPITLQFSFYLMLAVAAAWFGISTLPRYMRLVPVFVCVYSMLYTSTYEEHLTCLALADANIPLLNAALHLLSVVVVVYGVLSPDNPRPGAHTRWPLWSKLLYLITVLLSSLNLLNVAIAYGFINPMVDESTPALAVVGDWFFSQEHLLMTHQLANHMLLTVLLIVLLPMAPRMYRVLPLLILAGGGHLVNNVREEIALAQVGVEFPVLFWALHLITAGFYLALILIPSPSVQKSKKR